MVAKGGCSMDVSNLLGLIENDLERDGSYDRYPVRFISMKYEVGVSNTLIKLQQQIDNVELYDIKDLLYHEDGWIPSDRFYKAMQSLDKRKNYIIMGFSEYTRFLSKEDFISLLISLLELENPEFNPKRRLYIPCFALYSQIKKTIKTYHRRFDVYNPLLNDTDVEDLPRIYFINQDLNIDCHTNEVVNSSEWFGMWRNSEIDTNIPIICTSETLSHFYTKASPDNVYNIQRIKTYQDLLKLMYHINNIREYKSDPAKYFSRLLSLLNEEKSESLYAVILSEVNAQSINANNIYYLWKNGDTFSRWLIQNYILLYSEKESYLFMVMDRLEKLSAKEFIEVIYELAFELKTIALVSERNTILSSIKKVERDIPFTKKMERFYERCLQGIVRRNTTVHLDEVDFKKDDKALIAKSGVLADIIANEFAPYLTCFSKYERLLIIWLFRNKLLCTSQIKGLYPALYYYMGFEDSEAEPEYYSEKFDHYFRNYRKLRLLQEAEESYNAALGKWNQNENEFYSWYLDGKLEYPDSYLKKSRFHGNTYVLDAVGAEFLSFILRVLEENECTIESKAYGKCHLPSTTTVAQKYYKMENDWLFEYDNQVIHGETYYPVHNIERALFVIEKMIEDILEAEDDKEFAIIADHGATVGHKIDKKEKKYSFEKSEHDGRCCNNFERRAIDQSKDYVIYDDESGMGWVLALNQQSLYKNSKYAVHGGATLEEVLVPIIIAHKGKTLHRKYRVRAVNLNVSGLHKEVEFKIDPLPDDEKVMLKAKDGTFTELSYSEETRTWAGKLKRGIEQDIEVSVGTKVYKFRTVPPTKMGDDLFDD